MKKKWVFTTILGLAVILAGAGLTGCNGISEAQSPIVQTPIAGSPTSVPVSQAKSVDESMVQVWEAGQFAATGIAVGDGSQILTVLNYEVSTPADLEVVIPGGGRYPATIQCLDARTKATLLKIEGIKLPIMVTGNDSTVQPGQPAFLYDWDFPNSGIATAEPVVRKTPVIIGGPYADLPLWTGLQMTEEMKKEFPSIWINHGAVLTDESGKMIGVDSGSVDEFFYTISPGANPPFSIPLAIKINIALELLSPEASTQPWSNGPLEFIVVESLATASRSGGSVQNYAEVTAAISEVLNWMGSPLDKPDWQQYEISSAPGTQGVTLTVVYPRPVSLLDNQGEIVAQAKWVGIQWGLPGKQPNRVYYGDKGGTVLGGFIINGDLSNLEKIADPLAYHAP